MSNEMTGFTPSQFQKFLRGWWTSENYTDVVYVEGHHGIGKTDSVLQAAIEHFGTEAQKKMDPLKVLNMSNEERGWVFCREYPATKNVEDYTGVPFLRDGRTLWGVPDFFPREGKGVMVIEELNQATEDILKAFFPLLQDKRIGAHILSPTVFLVVTGNPPNSVHHVTDFPIALKDRMQRVGMVHSSKDWIKWASNKSVHQAVIGFIEENHTLLHVIPDDGTVGPTPRAWATVGRAVDAYEKKLIEEYQLVEVLKNRVGEKAAVKFFGHLKNAFKRAVSAEELLTDYQQFLPKYKEQSAAGKSDTIDQVMRWITNNISTMTKDSPEMETIKDLLINNVSKSILVAKAMVLSPDTINALVRMGPNGVAIGHKLASIRQAVDKEASAQ